MDDSGNEAPSATQEGLEDALIVLVMRHGAKVVLDTARDLYSQTREGKEEAAALAAAASDERWERQRQAGASRSSGGATGRKGSSVEEARRLLGG